jgi:hypothetical protein
MGQCLEVERDSGQQPARQLKTHIPDIGQEEKSKGNQKEK